MVFVDEKADGTRVANYNLKYNRRTILASAIYENPELSVSDPDAVFYVSRLS